jgi:hypothetical protein
MNRINLINFYLESRSNPTYLEIGVHTGDTLMNIRSFIKDSVDPLDTTPAKYVMTSDEFFERIAPTLPYKYDVIFIDGLHHTEQVDKDIANSLLFLKDDGVVILHDCNPINEMRQRVPADFDIWKYGWNGDVWKSIVKFRKKDDIHEVFVIDSDEGLGVIKKGIHVPLNIEVPETLTYEFLELHRNELLNLKANL